MDIRTSAQELPPGGIEDVPDARAELYLDIVDAAESTPAWLQAFFPFFAEASLILLLGLLLTWWRARDRDARTTALVLLAPVAMVVSYLTSEWAKTVVDVERPRRALDVAPIVPCPTLGDRPSRATTRPSPQRSPSEP